SKFLGDSFNVIRTYPFPSEDIQFLHEIFELPDIARPGELLQNRHIAQLFGYTILFNQLSPKQAGQGLDILSPLTQVGKVEADAVDAMEQVRSKLSLLDQSGQILIRGANDTDIDFPLLGLTDAANPLVFQGAKQFGLGLERHIPNFIQEQGAL